MLCSRCLEELKRCHTRGNPTKKWGKLEFITILQMCHKTTENTWFTARQWGSPPRTIRKGNIMWPQCIQWAVTPGTYIFLWQLGTLEVKLVVVNMNISEFTIWCATPFLVRQVHEMLLWWIRLRVTREHTYLLGDNYLLTDWNKK